LVGSAMRHVRTPGGVIDVRVSYDAVGATLSIAVRDDGPGIPTERLNRLLKRGNWQPGAALALLLVEDVVVAHGGKVEVESDTDRLAHFTKISLTLPA
jgi:signal transduction histidine kinase